ncbi:hypothetical protein BGX30_000432 [Mortierella sp. GBA39]|nr:hypothetical protein BGX30_000432 [Mortierella sp. GBA39]
MNSVKLTEEAGPVTMTTTRYILDKAPGNSTVIYAINPGTSSSLQRVDIKGGSPPFSKSYAATALNKQIVTYTPSVSGNPAFNSFVTTTQAWSGPGLMRNGGGGGGGNPTTPESSGTPIGVIVGGAVGGLVAFALVIFFGVRRRRRSRQQQQILAVATASSPECSYAKFRVSSYGGSGTPLSPQLYPEDDSPHTIASLSSNVQNSSP